MPRRAFTLVELLVVIGIMITLMSLIMGGVMLAKRSAQRAKAVSLLGTVASAIDSYRTLNGYLPEYTRLSTVQVSDIDSAVTSMGGTLPSGVIVGSDAYRQVFSKDPSDNRAEAKLVFGTGKITDSEWATINASLTMALRSVDPAITQDGTILDPWKKPLRYRPSKWYPFGAGGGSARVDMVEPPNPETYQLWSMGPDAKQADSAGEGGDDIPNWAKK
jgi:type II secretory pathway pseudopilin PulG